MEANIQEADSNLLEALRAPLGLGVALAISVGVGFGLSLLHKKYKKPQTEYAQLIRAIQIEIKKEQKNQEKEQLFSDDVFLMVYYCTSFAAKQEHEDLVKNQRFLSKRVARDFKKFQKRLKNFEKKRKNLLRKTLEKVLREAQIPQSEFLLWEKNRRSQSKQLQESYNKILESVQTVSQRIPHKRELTLDLIKEVTRYEGRALEEALSQYEVAEAKTMLLISGWIIDRIYTEFGVNCVREDYLRRRNQLGEVDYEFRAILFKNTGLVAEALNGLE